MPIKAIYLHLTPHLTGVAMLTVEELRRIALQLQRNRAKKYRDPDGMLVWGLTEEGMSELRSLPESNAGLEGPITPTKETT